MTTEVRNDAIVNRNCFLLAVTHSHTGTTLCVLIISCARLFMISRILHAFKILNVLANFLQK